MARDNRRARILFTGVLLLVVIAIGAVSGAYFWLRATRHVAFDEHPAADELRSAFDRLATALEARGTESLVVVRDGRLLYEWYDDAGALLPTALKLKELVPEVLERRNIASASKAVTGGLSLVLMVQEGLVDIDDRIGPYVLEWSDQPRRANLTIRELATHTAGLRTARASDELAWGREYMSQPSRRVALALDVPFIGEPGLKVSYSNPGYTILGYALSRIAQASPAVDDLEDYLDKQLYGPLDIPRDAWSIGYGAPVLHNGVKAFEIGGGTKLTARALGRIGGMLAEGGRYEERQLLDPLFLAALAETAAVPLPVDWRSQRQPAAALGWWVNSHGAWPQAPRDAMVAAGFDHRLLLVIPSLDLAVARTGRRLGEDGFHGDYWRSFERALLNPVLEIVSTAP